MKVQVHIVILEETYEDSNVEGVFSDETSAIRFVRQSALDAHLIKSLDELVIENINSDVKILTNDPDHYRYIIETWEVNESLYSNK